MKSLRSDSGGLLFKVEERLSKSQIQSWFSAYARERKAKMAVLNAVVSAQKPEADNGNQAGRKKKSK